MSTTEQTVEVSALAGPLLEKFLARKAAVEAEEQSVEATLTEADLRVALDEIQDSALLPAIEEIVATVPGAADLPPDQLAELVAEALSEVLSEAITDATA